MFGIITGSNPDSFIERLRKRPDVLEVQLHHRDSTGEWESVAETPAERSGNMASLNKIAREYAEEIREGIAWVIVWKTGRSWHATAVWLNPDTDTFEPDDLATAREVLAQDPNAVMVNGYYCGHLGEHMTVAELACGILWHYENNCNALEGSTAFPPEPIERPADLPADVPWYEMPTAEDPDPYVYDGHMSFEDFERRHELMNQEPKPPASIKPGAASDPKRGIAQLAVIDGCNSAAAPGA